MNTHAYLVCACVAGVSYCKTEFELSMMLFSASTALTQTSNQTPETESHEDIKENDRNIQKVLDRALSRRHGGLNPGLELGVQKYPQLHQQQRLQQVVPHLLQPSQPMQLQAHVKTTKGVPIMKNPLHLPLRCSQLLLRSPPKEKAFGL